MSETHELLRAAQLCDWPARTVAGRVVRGEEAWRAVLSQTTPRERAGVLRSFSRRELLAATPEGRQRLRRYLDRAWAGWPAPPGPVRFYGDPAMLPAVTGAVERLPTPVRARVLEDTYIIGVGQKLLGWTTPRPLPTEGLVPIVVSGHRSAEIGWAVHHEAGHVWIMPAVDAGARALTESEYATFLETARAENWPLEAAVEQAAVEEELVGLLAAGWGVG